MVQPRPDAGPAGAQRRGPGVAAGGGPLRAQRASHLEQPRRGAGAARPLPGGHRRLRSRPDPFGVLHAPLVRQVAGADPPAAVRRGSRSVSAVHRAGRSRRRADADRPQGAAAVSAAFAEGRGELSKRRGAVMNPDNFPHTSTGRLAFDPSRGTRYFNPWWALMLCDEGIIDYYAWLLRRRGVVVTKGSHWGAHVCF